MECAIKELNCDTQLVLVFQSEKPCPLSTHPVRSKGTMRHVGMVDLRSNLCRLVFSWEGLLNLRFYQSLHKKNNVDLFLFLFVVVLMGLSVHKDETAQLQADMETRT